MRTSRPIRGCSACSLLAVSLAAGCLSVDNKVTGTARSGAEQLLLTGALDQAIGSIDFRPLAGAQVFLEAPQLAPNDAAWAQFALRRALLEQGARLVGSAKEAQIVVEAAIGAYGTDDRDCRVSLPSLASLSPVPLPTMASVFGANQNGVARVSKQDAVVKLAVLARDARTHALVWESGTVLATNHLDRRFIGTRNWHRDTSLPELRRYPRRHKLVD